MGSPRHLSIGITANLDNYENLRLELSGEVEGEKDTGELITALDAILARLGRGTKETAERVDSYRRRVFTPLPGAVTAQEEQIPPVTPSAAPAPPPVAPSPVHPPPSTGHPPAPPLSPVAPSPMVPPAVVPLPRTEVSAPPAREPPSPAPRPAETPPSPARASPPPSPGDITCERCGAPITTVQRKLSRLFQNKDLCKKCLNQP